MGSLIRKDSSILKISSKEDNEILDLMPINNPFGSSDLSIEAVKNHISKIHIYPDIKADKLCEKISNINGLNVDQILTGNGSQEILKMIFQSFLMPGDEVIPFFKNKLTDGKVFL